jgi:hypothetical protein
VLYHSPRLPFDQCEPVGATNPYHSV